MPIADPIRARRDPASSHQMRDALPSRAIERHAAAAQHAFENPQTALPGDILMLQQHYGNRAVQRLINQAVQRKPIAKDELDPTVSDTINHSRGSGSSLPDTLRDSMEKAFGTDFSRVHIHTDQQSDQLNRSVQATAFTIGSDIYFRKGNYNPSSSSGKELLAHELTHVVQQGGTHHRVQGKLTLGPVGDQYEQEADRVAQQIGREPQRQLGLQAGAAQPAIQRELKLDTSWDASYLSLPTWLGGTNWAGIKQDLIDDFDEVEEAVDELAEYALESPQLEEFAALKAFVAKLNKVPPKYTTWQAYQNLRQELDDHHETAGELKQYVKDNKIITKKEHRAAAREKEKEERAQQRAEQLAQEQEEARQAKAAAKKLKETARQQRKAEKAEKAQQLQAELAKASVPTTTWNNEVDDALVQLNPKSRTDPNIMNHPVNQTSVTNKLPALTGTSQWIQVRTTLSGSDNHFRVFVEVDGDEPAPHGTVAVARGLSHKEVRDAGNFWCYKRAGKGSWKHQSGKNPYNL